MAQADVALLADLQQRVEALEARVLDLSRRVLDERLDLYGPEPDHAQARQALRGPGRPPKTDTTK